MKKNNEHNKEYLSIFTSPSFFSIWNDFLFDLCWYRDRRGVQRAREQPLTLYLVQPFALKYTHCTWFQLFLLSFTFLLSLFYLHFYINFLLRKHQNKQFCAFNWSLANLLTASAFFHLSLFLSFTFSPDALGCGEVAWVNHLKTLSLTGYTREMWKESIVSKFEPTLPRLWGWIFHPMHLLCPAPGEGVATKLLFIKKLPLKCWRP